MNKYIRRRGDVSEKMIRRALKNFFSGSNPEEFEEAICCLMDDDEQDPVDFAVDYFAADLCEYMNEHMGHISPIMGVTDAGHEVDMTIFQLFGEAGIRISKDKVEYLYQPAFEIENAQELWLLENGHFAQVRRIDYSSECGDATYRFVESFLKYGADCSMSMERLIENLDDMLSNYRIEKERNY